MTDHVAAPADTSPPVPRSPSALAQIIAFLKSGHLLARSVILAVLMFFLVIPLNLIAGIVVDRQKFQNEAEAGVTRSWSGPQTFAGPKLVVPYRGLANRAHYTLLPEKLSIAGRIEPQQRRRGLFAVTVYRATMDVVAEFNARALRELASDIRPIDWAAAQFELGVSDIRSIEISVADIDGRLADWDIGDGSALSSHRANAGGLGLGERETFTVRFRVLLAGSSSLSFVPLGRRTEVSVESAWPSPSFSGNRLPITQTVDREGFQASWAESSLGRRYSQLWDSASATNNPAQTVVFEPAFGVALINPVDAYRETDRTIKYAIMFIGLTFAACMLFEMATGTQPHVAQYGLIGLSLCVFYLLLLSFAERFGFLPAYVGSAAAIVIQATVYVWALQGSRTLGLVFGAILTGLYAGLYGLLQLEEASLLSGSILLFAVLSLAMWLTRNLHRTT